MEEISLYGGLIGSVDSATIFRCGSKGNLNIPNGEGAGFVGNIEESYINECFSSGNIVAKCGAGFALKSDSSGYLHDYGIYDSYSTGNVSISNDYEKNVSSDGGIFMYKAKDYLKNVYASGKITYNKDDNEAKKRFIDYILIKTGNTAFYNKDNVNNTYQDKEAELVGISTEQMKSKSSYNSFDFQNIWGIEDGTSTPYLLWEKEF